jgi:fatty-acyl-CoA synthase
MLSTMQDEPLSLATLLRHAVANHSRSLVTTWTDSGTRSMAFDELGQAAGRLANALRGLGVERGERVGTFMWNNNEHMTAYCAVPAMGAVLHTLNIRLFPDQVAFIVNHAADKVVILDWSLIPQFSEFLPRLSTVGHVIVANGDHRDLDAPAGVTVHSYDQLLAAHDGTFSWPVLDERSAAAACYTSGTTGDPKGVLYSHRSIWLHSLQVCTSYGMGISDRDDVVPIVPMFHAMAWGIPHAALMSGASLTMPDRFLQPTYVARMLADQRPTFAAAVPTVWIGLLHHLDTSPQDITHLRNVVVGGSAVPPSLMHAFSERHGVEIIQAWGMTETSPLGTVAWAPATTSEETAWTYRHTQGRFLPGVQARLVGDLGEVVAHDGRSLGELEVRGPWITGSYYSPPGSSPVDPDRFRDGWLRTGDIGKITHDGYLTLVDRSKDVIKSAASGSRRSISRTP